VDNGRAHFDMKVILETDRQARSASAFSKTPDGELKCHPM